MKKTVLLFLALLLCAGAYSQSNKLDKQMDKAKEMVQKGKLKEADEHMEKLLNENPGYGPGWDYLCKIRYKEYVDSKQSDNLMATITVSTKSKKGKEAENDSIAKNIKSLENLLNSMKPSKIAFDKYKYTLRKAILTANDAYYASQMLRNFFVDVEIDTAVNKKALKYFNDAEKEFEAKNYSDAAKLYKRAVEAQPGFYKAALYMADCFYFMGNYVEAIRSFKECSEKFPTLIEPRKYLVDAYAKEKIFDKATDEAIASLVVYPDQSIAFAKLDDAIYLNDKKLDIKWTPRGVFPNRVTPMGDTTDINRYNAPAEAPAKPWTFYKAALPTIKSYCDDKGVIVKPNTLTKAKYLEVYSWEEMLKNSEDPSLEEARRMQKEGYLDCYVMVHCYHFDFYDQYTDFCGKNAARIAEFYKKFILPAK